MPGISTNIWFDTQAEESASVEGSIDAPYSESSLGR